MTTRQEKLVQLVAAQMCRVTEATGCPTCVVSKQAVAAAIRGKS